MATSKIQHLNGKKLIGSSSDLNDCTVEGITYYIEGANVPVNAPEDNAYNAIIWIVKGNNYFVQYYASSNKDTVYYRFNTGSSWRSWKKVSFT